MARYSNEFKERAVARLVPPESAEVSQGPQEIGVSVTTLARSRADALSRRARERAWTAAACTRSERFPRNRNRSLAMGLAPNVSVMIALRPEKLRACPRARPP